MKYDDVRFKRNFEEKYVRVHMCKACAKLQGVIVLWSNKHRCSLVDPCAICERKVGEVPSIKVIKVTSKHRLYSIPKINNKDIFDATSL